MASAAAIVVAAGEGRRLGAAGPKAFQPVAGRAMFLHSLERLAGAACVAEQVLVVPAGEEDRVRAEHRADLERFRVVRVVPGGPRRQDSAAAGFRATTPSLAVVLIHDAARPLVTGADVAAVAAAAEREGAALLAVPLADTLKREGEDGFVEGTLDRAGLWRAQTPQAFRREVYAAALDRAARAGNPDVTDDAMLVERSGGRVALVVGNPLNIKITTSADMLTAEAVLGGGGGR